MDQLIINSINSATKPNIFRNNYTPNTLNYRFKALAKECGFVFWNSEPHGPGSGNIDWSCDYSKEFEQYSRELVKWSLELMRQQIVGEYLSNVVKKTYEHMVVQD